MAQRPERSLARFRRYPWAVLVAVAGVVILGLGAGVALLVGGDSTAVKMRNEFAGSYSPDVPAAGQVVEVRLETKVSSANVVGAETASLWTYNGTVPGPSIRVRLGDTLRATLVNGLPESTSIHWHGVRVPNAMDGVPGINQEPVEPGASFVYEFTPPDAGTFWFHSHTRGAEQLERGLYGSLIVEEPEPYGYSQDVVWLVDDWFLDDDAQLVGDFNEPHQITHNGRWGNVVTTNGVVSPELRGAPGERVRLRIINASNARTYAPEFDGLDVQVIAVDGLLVREPFAAHQFVMAPGNRIDVEFVIPDAPIEVFDNFNGEGFTLGTIVGAGDRVTTPEFATPSNPTVPEWKGADELEPDHTYVVSLGQTSDGWPSWRFNGAAFPEGEPEIFSRDEFEKVRVFNDSQMLHPIHLHGQFFKLVTRNGEAIDEGHFRDTILLMPGETIEIGLVALDVGTWALHCHIQEHAEAGMMTTFVVSP